MANHLLDANHIRDTLRASMNQSMLAVMQKISPLPTLAPNRDVEPRHYPIQNVFPDAPRRRAATIQAGQKKPRQVPETSLSGNPLVQRSQMPQVCPRCFHVKAAFAELHSRDGCIVGVEVNAINPDCYCSGKRDKPHRHMCFCDVCKIHLQKLGILLANGSTAANLETLNN